MSSTEIRDGIEGAWRQAVANRSLSMSQDFGFEDLLRNVALYGREACVDFVETHLARIVREAMVAVRCKEGGMVAAFNGFGKAAMDGVADTLRRRIGLAVDVNGSMLTLRWDGDEDGDA